MAAGVGILGSIDASSYIYIYLAANLDEIIIMIIVGVVHNRASM